MRDLESTGEYVDLEARVKRGHMMTKNKPDMPNLKVTEKSKCVLQYIQGEMSRDSLPPDFFDQLSPKKEALLLVLLNSEREWLLGSETRQRMREEYGLSIPDKPGATSIHQAHYTQWYSKEFSRNLIDARWADDDHSHAELRIGEKYEDELREYFGE